METSDDQAIHELIGADLRARGWTASRISCDRFLWRGAPRAGDPAEPHPRPGLPAREDRAWYARAVAVL